MHERKSPKKLFQNNCCPYINHLSIYSRIFITGLLITILSFLAIVSFIQNCSNESTIQLIYEINEKNLLYKGFSLIQMVLGYVAIFITFNIILAFSIQITIIILILLYIFLFNNASKSGKITQKFLNYCLKNKHGHKYSMITSDQRFFMLRTGIKIQRILLLLFHPLLLALQVIGRLIELFIINYSHTLYNSLSLLLIILHVAVFGIIFDSNISLFKESYKDYQIKIYFTKFNKIRTIIMLCSSGVVLLGYLVEYSKDFEIIREKITINNLIIITVVFCMILFYTMHKMLINHESREYFQRELKVISRLMHWEFGHLFSFIFIMLIIFNATSWLSILIEFPGVILTTRNNLVQLVLINVMKTDSYLEIHSPLFPFEGFLFQGYIYLVLFSIFCGLFFLYLFIRWIRVIYKDRQNIFVIRENPEIQTLKIANLVALIIWMSIGTAFLYININPKVFFYRLIIISIPFLPMMIITYSKFRIKKLENWITVDEIPISQRPLLFFITIFSYHLWQLILAFVLYIVFMCCPVIIEGIFTGDTNNDLKIFITIFGIILAYIGLLLQFFHNYNEHAQRLKIDSLVKLLEKQYDHLILIGYGALGQNIITGFFNKPWSEPRFLCHSPFAFDEFQAGSDIPIVPRMVIVRRSVRKINPKLKILGSHPFFPDVEIGYVKIKRDRARLTKIFLIPFVIGDILSPSIQKIVKLSDAEIIISTAEDDKISEFLSVKERFKERNLILRISNQYFTQVLNLRDPRISPYFVPQDIGSNLGAYLALSRYVSKERILIYLSDFPTTFDIPIYIPKPWNEFDTEYIEEFVKLITANNETNHQRIIILWWISENRFYSYIVKNPSKRLSKVKLTDHGEMLLLRESSLHFKEAIQQGRNLVFKSIPTTLIIGSGKFLKYTLETLGTYSTYSIESLATEILIYSDDANSYSDLEFTSYFFENP